MNGYELSRKFWDFSFENPEIIRPVHSAIYFFAIEHCNRLGWKSKFGFPSQMVMEAIGVRNWRTYSKALEEITEWGFLIMVEKSTNQYSSNIISIQDATVLSTKATAKALDKALSKHSTKHSTKQGQSIDSIDKQTNKQTSNLKTIPSLQEFKIYALEKKPKVCLKDLELKFEAWKVAGWKSGKPSTPIKNWKATLLNTLPYIREGEGQKNQHLLNQRILVE
jgi:hypothetical protein